jgi:hypothetical protein
LSKRICRIQIRIRRQRKEFRAGSFDAGAKSRSRIDSDVMAFGYQDPRDREHWIEMTSQRRGSDKNLHGIHSPIAEQAAPAPGGCLDVKEWRHAATLLLQP